MPKDLGYYLHLAYTIVLKPYPGRRILRVNSGTARLHVGSRYRPRGPHHDRRRQSGLDLGHP